MPTLTDRAVLAWAPVGKKSGKVLRDLRGRYAIYTHELSAVLDCPSYGVVKRVRITVVKRDIRTQFGGDGR